MTCNCPSNCASPIVAMLRRNEKTQAYQWAQRALLENPNCPSLHAAYGYCLMAFFFNTTAKTHFMRAMELGSQEPGVYCDLAAINISEGNTGTAEWLLNNAAKLAPDNPHIFVMQSKLAERDGDLETAQIILHRCSNPSASPLRVQKASIQERQGFPETAIRTLTQPIMTGPELLARGRLYEKLGEYELAWNDYQSGNEQLRERGYVYRKDQIERNFPELKRFATRQMHNTIWRADFRETGPLFPNPLFICGFPRTGTTMLEQSLSMHDQIIAGDELPFVGQLINNVRGILNSPTPYPFCVAEFMLADKRQWLDMMRHWFIHQANERQLIKLNTYFTDKMPMNEIHLPFISILFPNSKMIRMVRHPLDTILSNHSYFLSHGNNQGRSIEWAAHYLSKVDNLVNHYSTELENINLLTIKYEDLVDNMHGELAKIFKFLELGFDEKAVNFHENPRHAKTISNMQVKEPLHSRSVGRYKPFLKHMESIGPAVEGLCERWGYDYNSQTREQKP